MPSLISSLRDDFQDNLVANAWESAGAIGSATRTEASGRATLTLPSSTAGYHEASYYSVGDYDITGDGCWINIHQMVATGGAAAAYFRLRRSETSYLEWVQQSNTIQARYILNGAITSLHSATWSATTYKYLRIRESGGTITFESSSNGSSWTSRGTVTVATFGAVTALYVWFGATCGNVASPGSFVVEEFNTLTLATNWRWVEAARQEMHRIGSVSLAASAGVGYLAIASSIDASGNLVSPRYFAGPCGQGEELTEQSTQAAAQAMAVNLPSAGRWYLPKGVFVEGRYIRLFLRATSGSFTLREFYPRRFVQADDIEAESIRTRLLAAGAVTADKISVLQLSAITADMGSLTAGTITGALIRTAISGARIEQDSANGLRSYNSSNVVQVQIQTTDGRLKAGAGALTLDADGLTIVPSDSNPTAAIKWIDGGAVERARIQALAADGIWMQGSSSRQIGIGLNGAFSNVNLMLGVAGTTPTTAKAQLDVIASGGKSGIYSDGGIVAANFGASTPTPVGGRIVTETCVVTGSFATVAPITDSKFRVVQTFGNVWTRDNTNGVELHIRGNSSRNAFLTFTEEGIADRWTVWAPSGDDGLYFSSGSPGATTNRVQFKGNGRVYMYGLRVAPGTPDANEIYVDGSGFLKRG